MNNYEIGDRFMHIVGLEMTYLDSVKIGSLDPNAPNADDEARLFGWVDNNKQLAKLYFYDDQIEKWMKKIEKNG